MSPNTPLTVIATVNAKPGKEPEVEALLRELIPTTRQEPGCLNYDLHVANEQPTNFLLHENWTSQQHLQDHLARPHIRAFLDRIPGLVNEPPQITLWTRIA
jgi:quinol monooxygenase YgiN